MATATLPAHRISVADYVAGITAGDRALLARAITLVESSNPEHGRLAQSVLQELLPKTGKAVRLGITDVDALTDSFAQLTALATAENWRQTEFVVEEMLD